MLVEYQLRMGSANVLGNPDPVVAYAEPDLTHSVDIATTGRNNATGIARAVLDRVLAKLADCHEDRVADNRNIIELVDQRLQQPVGQAIDFGQLNQARRSNDHLSVVLHKCSVDPADVLSQAKGPKAPSRRLVKRLVDLNAASSLTLLLDPERQPYRKERTQANQAAGVQSDLIRALQISVKLRGVAVITPTCPSGKSELHVEHRMATSGLKG